MPAKEKTARLIELLKIEEPEQAIIFCRTKIGASRLERTLKDKGLDVKALHGDMSQGSRDGVMIAFKDHRVKLLVATDIAARGLDVEHVTHVINFDVPNSSETYVHRIGRTGRVGRTGRAITFVTPAERDEIGRIERDVNTKIGEWESPEERLEHAPPPRRRERRPRREREEAREPVEGRGRRGRRRDRGRPEREAEAVAASQRRRRAERRCGRRRRRRRSRRPPSSSSTAASAAGSTRRTSAGPSARAPSSPTRPIHDVRVLHRFSFVEVDPDQAERTVEFLDGTKLKGKEIRLEVAKS